MQSTMMEKNHGVDFGVDQGGGTMIVSDSSPFDALPEGCISNIISFAIESPRDACLVASVSKTFESAANSDSVWEKFLLPDYQSLIAPSTIFSSKKELYFTLCNESVLIEDGTVSLWLDKGSGKKCVMLSADHFAITSGDSPEFWQWISIPESRFEKVGELQVDESPFNIHGEMKGGILSPRIRYSAYIVYKTRDRFHDFQNVGVGFIGQGTHPAKSWGRERITKVEEREDGWMEVKFGEFFNEGGIRDDDRNDIVLYVTDINNSYWKRGFIIQGIELRPVKSW